jgi:hypothetical protein
MQPLSPLGEPLGEKPPLTTMQPLRGLLQPLPSQSGTPTLSGMPAGTLPSESPPVASVVQPPKGSPPLKGASNPHGTSGGDATSCPFMMMATALEKDGGRRGSTLGAPTFDSPRAPSPRAPSLVVHPTLTHTFTAHTHTHTRTNTHTHTHTHMTARGTDSEEDTPRRCFDHCFLRIIVCLLEYDSG